MLFINLWSINFQRDFQRDSGFTKNNISALFFKPQLVQLIYNWKKKNYILSNLCKSLVECLCLLPWPLDQLLLLQTWKWMPQWNGREQHRNVCHFSAYIPCCTLHTSSAQKLSLRKRECNDITVFLRGQLAGLLKIIVACINSLRAGCHDFSC